jgi:hypothetical protein
MTIGSDFMTVATAAVKALPGASVFVVSSPATTQMGTD